MTWGSFGWGAKAYSFGGKASCGGNYSSWSNHGWTYDAWSGGGKTKSWFDKDDDDKHGKHGWDKLWGKGRDRDDDEDDRDDKDCDDDSDGGRDGRWGRHHDDDRGGRGHKWWDRDDDDRHGGGCGRDDDDEDEDDGGDDTGGGGDTGGGAGDGKVTISFAVGDTDQLTFEVTQTPAGQLFFKVVPTNWDSAPTDIDGIFMNLTDDETAEGLHIHPSANAIPLTDQQIDPNAVNSLSDGTTLSERFDIGLQFGQVADSSDGYVDNLSFTLWSDNGPLTLEDVDLSRIALVTGLDNDDPQVIVGGYDDPATPEDETDTGLDDIMALMSQDTADEAEALAPEEEELDLAV